MNISPTRKLRHGVALLAFALGATLITPANVLAEEPNSQGARSIIGEAAVNGRPMNFAINLATGASEEQFNAAVELVAGLSNTKTLAQYPEFNTFFAQSSDTDFAAQVGAGLTSKNIAFDSVGPTRQAVVSGDELLVAPQDDDGVAANQGASDAGAHGVGSIGENQIDSELALNTAEDPTPVDKNTVDAWGLYAIHAIEAVDAGIELSPVKVGILDSGIDGNHPDLKDQIDVENSVGCATNGLLNHDWDAWQDDDGHGTHVSGTVAAAINGVGVQGVAPTAKLTAIKTGNAGGYFYPEYVTCAFDYAAKQGLDVTNSSYYSDPWEYWMPNEPNQAAGFEAVARAVAYSQESGVVNVAAAGNSDNDLDNLTTDSESPNDTGTPIKDRPVVGGYDIPTMLPGVISVSAVAKADDVNPVDAGTATLIRSYFSNYGQTLIDVAAPGTDILSDYPGEKLKFLDGTSMASPHAAGVAALIRAAHPDYTASQVAFVLRESADPSRLAPDPEGKAYEGHGLVDALAALTYPNLTADQTGAALSLVSSTVNADATIDVVLSGYYANEEIVFFLGDVMLAKGTTDASGALVTSLALPAGTAVGDYTLTALGSSSKFSLTTVVKVVAVEKQQANAAEQTKDKPRATKLPKTGVAR